MAITFRVDDVQAVSDRLPTRSTGDAIGQSLGVTLRHVSHHADLIAAQAAEHPHPLLEAVHVAFAQHRALTLSPDHVWLAISQGFATHVERNAEALRARFVRHEGKKELRVEVLSLPASAEEWGAVVGAFGAQIAGHVGAGIHRLLSCAFTTTTPVELTASGIVMMSTFKRYFDYSLACVCGIPEVTLEGTPADWAEIRRRVDVLAEYDLEWWAVALRPVLDQMVRAAEGAPDRDFWQCIYKPREVYGGEVVTGWIMRLFPYLGDVRSPAVLEVEKSADARSRWFGAELAPSSVPLAWSHARLSVETPDGAKNTLTLFAGFAGVRQLPNGALRPDIAWAVGETPQMSRLVERIITEHAALEPSPPNDDARILELPPDLIELYEKTDGAVLWGRWTLLRRSELGMLVGSVDTGFVGQDPRVPATGGYTPSSSVPALPFCVVTGDPRFLALYETAVILCDPRAPVDVENLPVVATSVADFLEQLFAHAGRAWFDESPPGELLYAHLSPYHDHLRRAVREPRLPDEPIPEVNARELNRLVMALCFRRVEGEAQRAHWWEIIQHATKTPLAFEHLFRKEKGRMPYQVLADLGLR